MDFSYQLEDFSCDLEELLLFKRLKGLAKFWSHVPEDINTPVHDWKYNDLALHLASYAFISHDFIAVKLLTAYNLAQVLRIRQCKHPYDDEHLNNIFLFLVNQLQKVSHERIDAYKYQERILEILVSKDVILVFCNLVELEKVIVNVYSSLIYVAHPDMPLTTKEGMIKLIGTLVEHSPNVPRKMVQMILLNCQNRVKMSNKLIYDINVAFISKYCDALGPAIEKVLCGDFLTTYSTHLAVEDDPTSTLENLRHILARLWKLHGICSGLTIPILRNLESALYTMSHECRFTLMIFLGKLFSNPSNVDLHKHCSSLWRAFLGRFQDVKPEIRLSCLNQVPDLFKIEDLRAGLISALGKRKMDTIKTIRNKLVLLVFVLLKDSHLYTQEVISDLSKILENSMLDHEFKVRCSGMKSMAELYDIFADKGRDYLPILKEVEKYPKYIMKHYWSYEKQHKKESLTVIQLLNRFVIPYSLPPDQRMKRLLKVLATLDSGSCSTLATIKYNQHINCKYLLGIIKTVKESRAGASVTTQEKMITLMNVSVISHDIPLPFQAAIDSVNSFVRKLSENGPEVEAIDNVLTHKSVEDIDQILESFKENKKDTDEFTWIFELCSDWLLDEESFKILLSYIDDVIRGRTNLCDELNLVELPLENVFKILQVLSASCLSCFHDQQSISIFISWFRMFEERSIKLNVLKILAALQCEDEEFLAKYPKVMDELILICQDSCSKSDTTLAKWSIRSLMIAEPKREELSNYLHSLVMDLMRDMTSSDLLRKYCSIYCLGYISLFMGTYFQDVIADVLSKQVINEVMPRKGSSRDASSISFTSPSIYMKIKARYLKFLGQYAYDGGIGYEDVFKLLFDVIEKGGKLPVSSSQRIRQKSSCAEGARHFLAMIQFSLYLAVKDLAVVEEVLEEILLSMVTDSDLSIRRWGLQLLLDTRCLDASNTPIRPLRVPTINFKAQNYYEMINWTKETVTPLLLLRSFTNKYIQQLLNTDLGPVSNEKPPYHTQTVERMMRNEMDAWMRLAAGRAVLRVLRGGTMDMLTCREFYLLSGLINDEVPEVRKSFFKKLHAVLHVDYPNVTLPPELLSLLIMANVEDGEESAVFPNMRYLFSKKVKFLTLHMEIEPFSDFDPHTNEVLVYGLLALSHSKIFTTWNDLEQLKKVKAKLKILLEYLLADESKDLSFYRKQVEMVKSHKLKGEKQNFTKKLWVLSDIALLLMKKRFMGAAPVAREPTLPKQFFEPEVIKNSRNYLSKNAIAELFAEVNQNDKRAKTEDDEEEASADESDESESDVDSLVVKMGEGNMTTEWDSDDKMSYNSHEESAFVSESPPSRRSSRKRKRLDF